MTRLRLWVGSPEHALVAFVISAISRELVQNMDLLVAYEQPRHRPDFASGGGGGGTNFSYIRRLESYFWC